MKKEIRIVQYNEGYGRQAAGRTGAARLFPLCILPPHRCIDIGIEPLSKPGKQLHLLDVVKARTLIGIEIGISIRKANPYEIRAALIGLYAGIGVGVAYHAAFAFLGNGVLKIVCALLPVLSSKAPAIAGAFSFLIQ